MTNILSFDIEDWFQSTYNCDHAITDRVQFNTKHLLDLLSSFGIRSTFFVQGMVAEAFPNLIRDIADAGHEVGTHGHSHRPVNTLGPAAFRVEVHRSKRLLEDVTGKPVIGFRAPDFSIDKESFWAFDVLAEEGIQYDSSVFPARTPRYGIAYFQRRPHRLAGSGIYEIPMSVWDFNGKVFPVAGGGYFRLFPYVFTRRILRKINLQGLPGVVYIHPYELNPDDFRGESVPWRIRLHQGLFRSRVRPRLIKLLKDFSFVSCGDWYEKHRSEC